MQVRSLVILSWLLIAGLWVYAIYAVTQLPNTIPVHFNFNNEPDNWGSKYTLLVLPFIATLIVGLFSVIKRYPSSLNYPVTITEQNAAVQQRLAFTLLSTLGCVIPLLFGYIIYSTREFVEHGSFDFPMLLILGAVFLPIGIYCFAAFRAR
jgi:hypothetical protein